MYYQPYIDLKTQKVAGAEALLRMTDDQGNILLPNVFMPLAEYLGFMVPIGEFVTKEAVKKCRMLPAAGYPEFTMSINLSSKQFKQKDIVKKIENILAEAKVDFSKIVVGISEVIALADFDRLVMVCSEFHKKGIKTALDEFGPGPSSFINMKNIPVDIVKAASVYIEKALQDDYSGQFIKLMVDLGHSMGKQVSVTGVETKEQLDSLMKEGSQPKI